MTGRKKVKRPRAHGVTLKKVSPFAPLIPNAETIEAMQEARAGKLHAFATVEELMADLKRAARDDKAAED